VAHRASSSWKSAPRPSPKSELNRQLVVAGFVALALLALGEGAPAAWPVDVVVEVQGTDVLVRVDGTQHVVSAASGSTWRGIDLDQPGALLREYQLDGSDTTSTNDRRIGVLEPVLETPLYALDAWLRDEGSYSRWERIRLSDPDTDQPLAHSVALSATPFGQRTELAFRSSAFRIEASLRRPEAPAHLWLLSSVPEQQEGLELDRDRRNARWIVQRGGVTEPQPRWFFPEQPMPFAAELLHLAGRSAAAGYALVLAVLGLSRMIPAPERFDPDAIMRRLPLIANAVLAAWLLAVGIVTTRLYHQVPHILDAVSYTFQAGVFRAARLWLEAPAIEDAFKGPFQVIWHEQWFSQYPPGAAAAYALGGLVGLQWLVGPVACAVLIGATAWTASALYGRAVGGVVLGLGVLSPFILFQAGSFLSHPIAGGLLAIALAGSVQAERTRSMRWYALSGACLGAGFVTREAASVLFALPLLARTLALRRWQGVGWLLACGLPFLLLYLAYNDALTGSALLLPRTIFDPSDRFGFGDGLGFHRRHTIAAGLANTDELLTILQFELFGWPPLFTLGLLSLPFLHGRPRAWDLLAAAGVLLFVGAYTAYFYHGIALGPRYYFEAVPWLLLLAGRGAQRLIQVCGSRAAVGLVLGLLSLNTLLFYLPAEVARRTDYSGYPGARPLTLAFVRVGVFGPRLENVPTPSLILSGDWWLFNTALAPLNCPTVPDCPALFALATTPEDAARLRATYPGRIALHTVDHDGRVDIEPD